MEIPSAHVKGEWISSEIQIQFSKRFLTKRTTRKTSPKITLPNKIQGTFTNTCLSKSALFLFFPVTLIHPMSTFLPHLLFDKKKWRCPSYLAKWNNISPNLDFPSNFRGPISLAKLNHHFGGPKPGRRWAAIQHTTEPVPELCWPSLGAPNPGRQNGTTKKRMKKSWDPPTQKYWDWNIYNPFGTKVMVNLYTLYR